MLLHLHLGARCLPASFAFPWKHQKTANPQVIKCNRARASLQLYGERRLPCPSWAVLGVRPPALGDGEQILILHPRREREACDRSDPLSGPWTSFLYLPSLSTPTCDAATGMPRQKLLGAKRHSVCRGTREGAGVPQTLKSVTSPPHSLSP